MALSTLRSASRITGYLEEVAMTSECAGKRVMMTSYPVRVLPALSRQKDSSFKLKTKARVRDGGLYLSSGFDRSLKQLSYLR